MSIAAPTLPANLRIMLDEFLARIASEAFEAGRRAGRATPTGNPSRTLTIADVQKAVAESFGVSVEEMRSDRTSYWIAHPRQVAMLIASEVTPSSMSVIGRHFNRDHTTVIYAIRAVKKRCLGNPSLAEMVAALRSALTGA